MSSTFCWDKFGQDDTLFSCFKKLHTRSKGFNMFTWRYSQTNAPHSKVTIHIPFFLIKLCHDSTEQIYYAYSCFKLSPMYICTIDSLSLSLYKMSWAQLFKRWITLSTGSISTRWIARLFFLLLIRRWIVIYPVNGAIQRFNNCNWGLECEEAPST